MPRRSMPAVLTEGFERFRAGAFARQHALFESLSHDGQKPHCLVIACCDSRVDPAQIFDAAPGELFVVRNVANIVPPFLNDGRPHGVSAALEFAVTALEIPNILVLGHRQCGGVRAGVCGGADSGSLFIDDWLAPLEEAVSEARLEAGENAELDAVSERAEICAIRGSLERLQSFPFIAERLQSGAISLHGARFGIADGGLEWLTVDGEFVSVEERRPL